MSFFKGRFTKEGPGIPKDAPSKKGLRLFFEIFVREFWDLVKLNLTFLLACIPIVTIPCALGGMFHVIMKMIRDEPTYVWHDFWDGFKKNWKQSIPAGILSLLLILSVASSLWLGLGGNNVFLVLGLLTNIIAGFTLIYLYPMIVTVDLSFGNALKNSVLIGFSCMGHAFAALAIIEILLVLMAVFFIYAFPVIVLIGFSLTSFISGFAAWAGIKKYVINDGTTETEPDAEADID